MAYFRWTRRRVVAVAVAMLVVGAAVPFTANWISDQLSVSVGAALSALHVA